MVELSLLLDSGFLLGSIGFYCKHLQMLHNVVREDHFSFSGYVRLTISWAFLDSWTL